MDNGVLTVTFPKSTPELAPKRINVAWADIIKYLNETLL
jgi:hypothetical protein